MDGRGRAFDNIFVERPWRSLKYEEVYLKGYGNVSELELGCRRGCGSTITSGCTRHWITELQQRRTTRAVSDPDQDQSKSEP